MATAEAVKDKHGAILKIGDYVQNAKKEKAQLQNVGGVSILKYANKGVILRKVDFTEIEKIGA